MSFYWIYDIPNWQLGVLTVAAFVTASLAGLFATRPLMRRLLGGSAEYNDLVSYFLSAIGVFYGLALGLIAVATWENYSEVDELVSREAADLSGLYRDLDGYPQPLRGRLEQQLRDYVRLVIEKEWPAHRRGESLDEASARLDEFENAVLAFEPAREKEKIAHAEALRSLGRVVEQRGMRVQSVDTALPASLWCIVLLGAMLNIVLTYFFWSDHPGFHAALVAILATFIALLVFLTAAMDNPFRGEFSVQPDALKSVLDQVMVDRAGSH